MKRSRGRTVSKAPAVYLAGTGLSLWPAVFGPSEPVWLDLTLDLIHILWLIFGAVWMVVSVRRHDRSGATPS